MRSTSQRRTHSLVVVLSLATAIAMVGLGRGHTPVAAQRLTQEFFFTGAGELWEVPQGIQCVKIVAYGAQGGQGENPDGTLSFGGLGGMVSAEIAVTPGETLGVLVGGSGITGTGGFNGGGDVGSTTSQRGGGGGGASDVRREPFQLADRLITAGGGGGGGADNDVGRRGTAGKGGDGGFLAEAGNVSDAGTAGGEGGSQVIGGRAGAGDPSAGDGDEGFGGLGGSGPSSLDSGGGGGGGYYGGGGGAGEDENVNDSGGGGGGGASFAFNARRIRYRDGVRQGNGLIQITVLSKTCVP